MSKSNLKSLLFMRQAIPLTKDAKNAKYTKQCNFFSPLCHFFSLAVLYINFHFNLENLKKEEGKNANNIITTSRYSTYVKLTELHIGLCYFCKL